MHFNLLEYMENKCHACVHGFLCIYKPFDKMDYSISINAGVQLPFYKYFATVSVTNAFNQFI